MLYPSTRRIPDAASPDVRARSYAIVAELRLTAPDDSGVLISHGDCHAGYALRIDRGHPVHDYVRAERRTTTRSFVSLPVGEWVGLSVSVIRTGVAGMMTIEIDGVVVARDVIPSLARERVGWTGVDIGCDRGETVGDYLAPARFTGELRRVSISVEDDQWLDDAAVIELEKSLG